MACFLRYVVIMKFDTMQHLDTWMNSDDRKALLAELGELIEGNYEHEVRQGAVVAIDSAKGTPTTSRHTGPPSMLKVALVLHVNVRVCGLGVTGA